VITGSLAGLMLVYSVDLPQIHDLERYRPSTTTDLYDRKGRIIGSFALERREVVNYEDFAPVLRQAVISIEDKSFASHWVSMSSAWLGRRGTTSAVTAALRARPRSPCNWRATCFSLPNAPRRANPGSLSGHSNRARLHQGADLHLYGNQIYLGSGMYGFEAASQFYFSKHARESDAD